MSIRIMSKVWDHGPSERGELLVMLALADFSNDDGECWPSVAAIGKKARMDERSARRILRKLEAAGWLSVDVGGGRHGCSKYTINTDTVPPGQNAPPDKMSQKPGQNEPETRTPVSPEPSRTINNHGGGGSACAREAETTTDQPTDRERILDAIGVGPDGMAGPSRFLGGQGDMAEAKRWLALPGIDVETACRAIREVMAAKRDGPPANFRYFTPAMQRLSAQLSAPQLSPQPGTGPPRRTGQPTREEMLEMMRQSEPLQ